MVQRPGREYAEHHTVLRGWNVLVPNIIELNPVPLVHAPVSTIEMECEPTQVSVTLQSKMPTAEQHHL
jgi:hypothetical protein